MSLRRAKSPTRGREDPDSLGGQDANDASSLYPNGSPGCTLPHVLHSEDRQRFRSLVPYLFSPSPTPLPHTSRPARHTCPAPPSRSLRPLFSRCVRVSIARDPSASSRVASLTPRTASIGFRPGDVGAYNPLVEPPYRTNAAQSGLDPRPASESVGFESLLVLLVRPARSSLVLPLLHPSLTSQLSYWAALVFVQYKARPALFTLAQPPSSAC